MNGCLLICGGGIGGLSAAIALSRESVPVRVLEQAPSFSEAGAGIEIGPNAARHLDAWGLLDIVESLACEPDGIRIYDGLSGAILNTVPLGDFVRERYGAPYLLVHRKHLQFCLLEAANMLDGIEIETGFRVTGLDVQSDGVIADSEIGGTVHGSALVGADGIWSTVRLNLTDQEPKTVGVTAWRALLPASEVPALAQEHSIGVHLGPHHHLIHYPVAGGTTINVVAMINETINFDGWASSGEQDDLLPFFHGWSDQVIELLNLPDEWFKWTVMSMAPLARWGEGLVTLIGDAAHPMEPFLAQGGGTAIEDAASLSAAVAANPEDLAAAFRIYETARQPRAARIQKASHQRGRGYRLGGVRRWARNMMLSRRPPETLLTQYDWLYGPSN